MKILFISDYVCPYCLAAKEALKQAMEETGIAAEITWQPYELTPEPKQRVDTFNDERRRKGYQVLVEPCRQLGLDMKLPPRIIPRPYTRLAFEGWFYACDKGAGDAYNDGVYRAYFIDEKDIGDAAVLADIAASVGLDADDFASALQSGKYTEREKAAVEYARSELKPSGVPTIYVDGEKISLNGYTKEDMIRVLTEHSAAAEEPVFRCGEDGCSFDDMPACGEDGCKGV